MAGSGDKTPISLFGASTKTAYGPVELPTLVAWVKDERVTADTWIFVARTGSWQKAGELPELQILFPAEGKGANPNRGGNGH